MLIVQPSIIRHICVCMRHERANLLVAKILDGRSRARARAAEGAKGQIEPGIVSQSQGGTNLYSCGPVGNRGSFSVAVNLNSSPAISLQSGTSADVIGPLIS